MIHICDPSRWTISSSWTDNRVLFWHHLVHLQDFYPFNISMIRVPCYYLPFEHLTRRKVTCPDISSVFRLQLKASWNSLTFSKTGFGIVMAKDKDRLNLNCGLRKRQQSLIAVFCKTKTWPAFHIWRTNRQDVDIQLMEEIMHQLIW